jgi:competence protein ComFC
LNTQVIIRPKRIHGKWRVGYALDYHTVKSVFLGYDQNGHALYDTQRSEMGELLYRLKYRNDNSVVGDVAETVAAFIQAQKLELDWLIPVPPSKPRQIQPLVELAKAIGQLTALPICDVGIAKIKKTPQLKDVYEYQARLALLEGSFTADPALLKGRNILLLDDLYRSGATLNVITTVAYNMGGAANVYVLALTMTRSKA